jgi:glycosyltransferase involved in cell wall biosynthesis
MSLAVSVVIAAPGEDSPLAPLLEKCRPHASEILVVGAAPGRARDAAARFGARVEPAAGPGRGLAVRRGVELARGDIVVLLDADGSHDPGDIPKLIAPIAAGQAEHAIASRPRGGADAPCSTLPQLLRDVGDQVVTFAINRRFGLRLTDARNGFRALLTSALRRLHLHENGPGIEQEITVASIRQGLKLVEVPIHGYPRTPGTGSAWRSAPRTALSTLKHLLRG